MDERRDILSLPHHSAPETLEVSALLVDVCGAVFDHSHWRRWLYQLLLKMGLHTNYVAFYRLWDQDYQSHVKRGQTDFSQAMQAFLLSAGLTNAQTAEVWVALRARKRDFERTICPMPGVAVTLRELRASGYRLAALVTPEVEQPLQQLGLHASFQTVFHCADVDRGPGAESGYQSAMARWANCEPDRVALISQDSWELERAAAASLRTVAVNFEGAIEADAHLEHFGQIGNLLTYPKSQRLAG